MLKTLLVANRGEIAIRILRAASELGLRTVAIHSTDDATSLHTRKADEARSLDADGPAAYLDIERVLQLAAETGADAIHPGYGFLAENARFAARCAEAGITFVGPSPEVLALFGDKAAARALADRLGVPVLRGTPGGITVDDAAAFQRSLGPDGALMLKATAGGGGRGSRIVTAADELAGLYERCRSEAASAFGDGTLFAEELVARARHVEVQIVGDGTRRGQPPVGARVQPPAPPPEARRDRPGAAPRPCDPRRPPRRRRADGDRGRATAASGRSSSSSTPTPAATSSSRPTPGCRSSTPSPRRCSASTSCGPSSSWPAAARSPRSGSTSRRCRRHAASPCSAG